MANFSKWVDTPGRRRYGRLRGAVTYQDWADDAGNYNSGVIGVGPLVGTNRSISAIALSSWRGYPVTKEEMMALTLEEAKAIMKAKFWDKIRGDEIKSQLIAEFIGDLKSSTGNIKIAQKALNNLGAGLTVDGSMGNMTLEALNNAITQKGEKAVYNELRKESLAFFAQMSNRKYGEAQVKHLDKDYPPYDQLAADRKNDMGGGKKKWLIWLVVLVVVLVLGWFVYRYRSRVAAWFGGGSVAVVAVLILIPFVPPF